MGVDGRLDIMVSNGGFTEADVAARFPIRLLESGPAGGVLSAINCGAVHGTNHVLAFDMGGTTAKSCVAIGGDPAITHVFEFARVRRFKKGSGLPAVAPSIDLIEIGAGGGSIARIGPLGLLQVGPDSAGSEPGPACYGLGGEAATVTDSDLALGYLDADNFLGGRMKLDVGKAQNALAAIGAPLSLTALRTAWGIHDIVNENMAAAARTHIAEHGHDARNFTMVATGGAGPVHAVDVARRLRIRRILCPVASGVGSCLGFLAAAARGDRSWSKIELVAEFDRDDFARRLAEARGGITQDLAKANVRKEEIRWQVLAEIRYLGQGASVQVDFGDADAESLTPEQIGLRFQDEYVRLFIRPVPGGVPELVTWRITGQSSRETRRYAFAPDADRATGAFRDSREIYLPAEKRHARVPVHDRHKLSPGASLAAPLVLVEPESTLVVAYPATVSVLDSGTVEVVLEERP
jgi:N-methylhydantoinase A